MTLDQKSAKIAIVKHNLPQSIRRFATGEDPLGMDYQSPAYIYAEGGPKFSENYIPLFEWGITVYFYEVDDKQGRYISINLEDPGLIDVYGKSEQCLLASAFILLWEWEKPDEELRTLSKEVGFKYIDELLSEIETRSSLDWEEHKKWRASFFSKCEQWEKTKA